VKQITEAELQQMKSWNETQRLYPFNRSIPELIAEHATHNPDTIALSKESQIVTYAELNRYANQLAQQLLTAGVQRGTLVGVCMERSIEAVIAMLGIMKIGGVYVPIDPHYPAKRITYMLENAAISLLITQQELASTLPFSGIKLIFIDNATTVSDASINTENPAVTIAEDDIVYTLYTSGSTGVPKGVQITHAGLLNLIYWHREAFGLTAADKATEIASLAFDLAGWEIWANLTAGAHVLFIDEVTRTAPPLLHRWLIENKITITFIPTLVAEELLQLDWPAATSLRYMLTGADRLRHYPPAGLPFAFINNYGPTEATVVTTSGQIQPISAGEQVSSNPTIGRPISNMQLYILDEQLQQVPIGETGELYIGGIGLAKGYLNRPELNEQRFIRNPFSTDPQARLYKTGDICSFLPDGQVAFVGRSDFQVKIRGYRIEPGEIEHVLNQQTEVAHAVAVAAQDTTEHVQLIAFVQPRDIAVLQEANTFIAHLRQNVADQLPDYMVPEIFVLQSSFPLTHNGKVDTEALLAVYEQQQAANQSEIAIDNDIEQQVTEIITTVLGQEHVEPDDNFFMLGGHSLLGAQVIAKVTDIFGVNIPLRTLFSSPTIRELSEEIEALLIAQIADMSEEEAQALLDTVHD